MRIPTDEEILAVHEKHAPTLEALHLVYEHCLIVCKVAAFEKMRAAFGEPDLSPFSAAYGHRVVDCT